MLRIKKFVSSLLVATTMVSCLPLTLFATEPSANTKAGNTEPIEPPKLEYYQLRGGYLEIMPYPDSDQFTYGIASTVGKGKADSYVGENKDKSLSTTSTKKRWGDHGAILLDNLALPKTMPDGAVVEGVEWVAPLLDDTTLPNGVAITDAYSSVSDVYANYKESGNKNLPMDFNLATPGVKSIVIDRDARGYMPQWEQAGSMQTSLSYPTPKKFNASLVNPKSSYDIQGTGISAKPPKAHPIANPYGEYWTKNGQVTKATLNDAMEIRAHWKFGHNVTIGKDLTYEQLQKYRCKVVPYEFTDAATGKKWTEFICGSVQKPAVVKSESSNPVRKNPKLILDDNFSQLTEADKQYYVTMANGTYQSNTFFFGNFEDSYKEGWAASWSKQYIVPAGIKKEPYFADMFNGIFQTNKEEYRTYVPVLVKLKATPPPPNLKMPYSSIYGAQPNDAVVQNNVLKITPVAVLDQFWDREKPVPARIQLTIKNRTQPGLNEFSGYIPYVPLEYRKPVNYMTKITDSVTGQGMEPIITKNTINFELQPSDKVQEIYIRMEVNPEDNPKEPNRKDNVWEKIVKVKPNNVDLIASSITVEATNPTSDWKNISTNVNLTTLAKGTQNPEFLKKFPQSPVKAQIWIDGALQKDKELNTVHDLERQESTKTIPLVLPNDPNKPGYKVTIRLEINEPQSDGKRKYPPEEVTFDNNVIEKEFFIPTIKKPEPIPPKPPLPDPESNLPMYDDQDYECIFPTDTIGTNQRPGATDVFVDTGTMQHEHDKINWTKAKAGQVNAKSIADLNWGLPGGFSEVIVHGWDCPQQNKKAPQCCYKYLEENQEVAAFKWWDTRPFQTSYGATQNEKFSSVYEKLRIVTKTVQDHKICKSDCCYAYSPSGHLHNTKTEYYYCGDKDCNTRHSRTVCVGRAPSHYHSHTEYAVKEKKTVNLQHNVHINPLTVKTVDHATGQKWTRAGYGIYSTVKPSYIHDLKTPANGCCDSFNGEAYLFMPHLNKEKPHRIVKMEETGSRNPFPSLFETARNKKTMQNARKQFVDVDYPDGQMKIDYRVKVAVPSFTPTPKPRPEQQALIRKYPGARVSFGICEEDEIKITGNMWDDAWTHPDDPVTLQPPR